jgi:type I restriction enzyme M protein
MRRRIIELDLIECVLGLGPNLFYNSPMEACVVVCRTRKPPDRQGRVLFIDAVHEVARERALSFLKPEHQEKILKAYQSFSEEPGFAAVATVDEILANEGNLSIPRYVKPLGRHTDGSSEKDLAGVWAQFEASGREFWQQMDELIAILDGMIGHETNDG